MSDPVDTPSVLLRRRKKLGKRDEAFLPNESFIPEDVLLDILFRLPAKAVLRCRCVCRGWRDITSTNDFIQLHIRRSAPMIVKDRPVAFLDKCWEPTQTRSKILKLFTDSLSGMLFSQNGLIGSADNILGHGNFVICNPIYRENVKIRIPVKQYKSEIYGVFFHPILKEYCTLWRMTASFYPSWRVHYRILNLGPNPHWREIKKNPSTQNARIEGINPVLVDDKYLYWIAEPNQDYKDDCVHMEIVTFDCKIIEFDTVNEEFMVMDSPVPLSVKMLNYNLNLLDIDGVLSLIKIHYGKELIEINIWTLQDRMEQSWKSCSYIVSCNVYPVSGIPQPVALWKGELVLLSGRRLYVCNLEMGTTRRFGQKYKSDVTFLSHMTNLASLKNCKSEIRMEEE